jgi:hypothetical protein
VFPSPILGLKGYVMDRIQELLSNITNLSDDELNELRDLVVQQLGSEEEPDGDEGAPVDAGAPGAPAAAPAPVGAGLSLDQLEELAEAATAVRNEFARRDGEKTKRTELAAKLAEFKADAKPAAPAAPKADDKPAEAVVASAEDKKPEGETKPEAVTAGAGEGTPQVPEDNKPKPREGGFTVVTAGADLPGFAMGSEIRSQRDLAEAFSRRIDTMRGIRGGDGDKIIVASAKLAEMINSDRHLSLNAPEVNLQRVMDVMKPSAIVAAGGLGAPEESRYELFGAGDTDRPVRDMLPVFTTDRGGVRFMRPPTLNDVNGVVGIWTVQNDIDAVTNPAIRKPSFRVAPGPEIVVDIQAITMIMTFGNLMSRAYPELVARHTDLGQIAQARVAEQQLLTQIGALSTQVSGRTQKLGAIREVLRSCAQATASYRNRHRIAAAVPMRAIFPVWFREVLRADLASQHPGDGLDIFELADARIDGFFRSRNINVTWAMDGEAGQDYSSITKTGGGAGGGLGIADFPTNVVWYLFVDGTFAFMDGGTLDLGLVRDSTLNAANDYQMFVETFENVVKFGHESLRVVSPLVPTGQGSIDVAP